MCTFLTQKEERCTGQVPGYKRNDYKSTGPSEHIYATSHTQEEAEKLMHPPPHRALGSDSKQHQGYF